MKIDIDAKKIMVDLGFCPSGKMQKFIANTCYKHMDKYVPYYESNLRKNVSMSLDGTSITYESPYAQYQYYGKLMVMKNGKGAYYSPTYGFWSDKGEKKYLTNIDLQYHTAGTGPYWDKRMITAEGDKVIQEIQDELRRIG